MILQYPLKSVRITQVFGDDFRLADGSWAYKSMGLNGHNGLDFGCTVGTLLYAPCHMIVKVLGNEGTKGYGKYIRAWTTDKKYELTMAHLSSVNPDIKVGMAIEAGAVIAQTGNTGFSIGPHLHFGVRELTPSGDIANYGNGYKGAIDPKPFFMDPLQTFEPEQIDALKWHTAKKFSRISDPLLLREPISRIDFITSMYRYHIDLKAQLAKQNIIIE